MLKKAPMKFDKELFKGTVLNNIKTLYRRTLEEATEQQIFQAVSYAIKDVVVDNWMATQKEYEDRLLYVHGVPDGSCAGQQSD